MSRKNSTQKLGMKLRFGKYEGELLDDVIENNPKYIEWCDKNIKWFKLGEEAKKKYLECLKKAIKKRRKRSSRGTYDPAPTLADQVHGITGPDGGWGNGI